MAKDDRAELEATEDQLDELRELGVREDDLIGLSLTDADDLIAELRARRHPSKGGGI